MAIALAISGMPRLVIDAETITIGSDPAASVVLTDDDRIKPRHAVIRRVAGRWLIEAREAESIQVGELEPGRVHWLSAGDVIRLVEDGPRITFQPSDERPVAAAIPLVSAAPAVHAAAIIPLAAPADAPPGPAETIAPVPADDSLFAPLTRPGALLAAPRREAAAGRTPPAAPARKPKRHVPRDVESNYAGSRRSDDEDEYAIADPSRSRQVPMLRRSEDRLSGLSSSSRAPLGWTTIWVALGLIFLLIVAAIWFGGGSASGGERGPAVNTEQERGDSRSASCDVQMATRTHSPNAGKSGERKTHGW
jgi:hypothetical protein